MLRALAVFLFLSSCGTTSGTHAGTMPAHRGTVAEATPTETVQGATAPAETSLAERGETSASGPAETLDRALLAEAQRAYEQHLLAFQRGDRATYALGYSEQMECFYGADTSRDQVIVDRAALLERNHRSQLERSLPVRVVPIAIVGISAREDEVVLADFGWTGTSGAFPPVTFHSKRVRLVRSQGTWRIAEESALDSGECGGPSVVQAPPLFRWMQERWRVLYEECEKNGPGFGGSNGCDLLFGMSPELYCEYIGRAEDERCQATVAGVLTDFADGSPPSHSDP